MWMFWNVFKSFFSSKEEAQINAKKAMELKDEWCEKSWEYEKPLMAIINLLRDEEEDWIDVNKLQSLLDEKTLLLSDFLLSQKKFELINWINLISHDLKNLKIQIIL